MELWTQVMELREQAYILQLQYFKNEVLFTFRWWVLILIAIVPWYIWWKLVDKKQLVKITMFGLFNLVIILILDEMGTYTRLWDYKYPILPYVDISLTADITVFTVTHILIYQYFPKWQGFIIANIILAVILAFVMEPLGIWAGYYVPLNWEHIYSLPIYASKALVAKWLTEIVFKMAKG